MTFISRTNAPDLRHLHEPVIATYMLCLIYQDRGGSDDPLVRSLIHAYILSNDKALRAYNLGRSLLVAYIDSRNSTTTLLHALAEFETCISTLKRCLALADRMAAHPANPKVDRTRRRQLDSYQQKMIRPMRDAIEHLDADLMKIGGVPGEPQMLTIPETGDRLVVGQHELALDQLGAIMETVHALATQLASQER